VNQGGWRIVGAVVRASRIFLAAISFCGLSLGVQAAVEERIDEPMEEAQTAASAMARAGSWVAVPIPVSNPTVGTGLQGVLLYLHPQQTGSASAPNATSGLVGMYTNNGSWATGAFHDGSFANGIYRYRIYAGGGDFNLKFYGTGADSILADNPVKYSLQATGIGGQVQRRVPDDTSNWYAGISYLYVDSEVSFKTSNLAPDLPDVSQPFRTAGAGLVLTYDTRDDNYYPRRGSMFQLSATDYGARWGGNYEYTKRTAFYNHYLSLNDDTTLVLRANLQSTNGDVPFFALAYLDMRGFSRDRYRDQNSLSVHAEVRYKFLPRWGAVAFTEAGRIGDTTEALRHAQTVTSHGAGLRWKVTADKALHLGVDFAFSGGESVFYIHVGEMF
jgi:hypothetical protein